MYTRHGHQIPNTRVEERPLGLLTARCGGIHSCVECASECVWYANDKVVEQSAPEELDILENNTPKSVQTDDILEGENTLELRTYHRKPFEVLAVRVTSENFEKVAEWCGGSITTVQETSTGLIQMAPQRHISVPVHRPLSKRQTEARIGDWILYASKGYKVYANRPFLKNFETSGISKEDLDIQPRQITSPLDLMSEPHHDPLSELFVTNYPTDDTDLVGQGGGDE